MDLFFFFQAEDGIRDDLVTGVQTCALPIFPAVGPPWRSARHGGPTAGTAEHQQQTPVRHLPPPPAPGGFVPQPVALFRRGQVVPRPVALSPCSRLWRPERDTRDKKPACA